MKVKEKVGQALREFVEGEPGQLKAMIEEEPAVIRHLLGFTYSADQPMRAAAARGLALAAASRPRLVQEVARRLVWAMNDESGTNAQTAPGVLQELAAEAPELLLPMVPDLTRLAGDPGLRKGLLATLEAIRASCPGEVGEILSGDLNRRNRDGDRFEKQRRKGR